MRRILDKLKLFNVYILMGLVLLIQGCALGFDRSTLASTEGSYQNSVMCIAIFTTVSRIRSGRTVHDKWIVMVGDERAVLDNVFYTIRAHRIDEDISNTIEWIEGMRTTTTYRNKYQPIGGSYTETTTITESDYYKNQYMQENLPYCENRYNTKTKPYYDRYVERY